MLRAVCGDQALDGRHVAVTNYLEFGPALAHLGVPDLVCRADIVERTGEMHRRNAGDVLGGSRCPTCGLHDTATGQATIGVVM